MNRDPPHLTQILVPPEPVEVEGFNLISARDVENQSEALLQIKLRQTAT